MQDTFSNKLDELTNNLEHKGAIITELQDTFLNKLGELTCNLEHKGICIDNIQSGLSVQGDMLNNVLLDLEQKDKYIGDIQTTLSDSLYKFDEFEKKFSEESTVANNLEFKIDEIYHKLEEFNKFFLLINELKSEIDNNSKRLNEIVLDNSSKDKKVEELTTILNNYSSKLKRFINNIDSALPDIQENDVSEKNIELYDEEFYRNNAKESYDSALKVIEIFKQYYQPKSVIDLGCGVGTWLKAWQENGVSDVLGIDANKMPDEGLYIPRNNLKTIDFENDDFSVDKKYDLAQSLECLEHISPENEEKVLLSLCNASNLILFSAAIPMQIGTHHINCHKLQYWVSKFRDKGYKCYDIIRPECIKNNIEIGSWYIQNILVFAKNEKAEVLEKQGAVAIEHPVLFYHSAILKDILSLF